VALRWKWEDCRLKRSGSGVCKISTFKAVAPPVSVMDRSHAGVMGLVS
jgi:hypothetical protein